MYENNKKPTRAIIAEAYPETVSDSRDTKKRPDTHVDKAAADLRRRHAAALRQASDISARADALREHARFFDMQYERLSKQADRLLKAAQYMEKDEYDTDSEAF